MRKPTERTTKKMENTLSDQKEKETVKSKKRGYQAPHKSTPMAVARPGL